MLKCCGFELITIKYVYIHIYIGNSYIIHICYVKGRESILTVTRQKGPTEL